MFLKTMGKKNNKNSKIALLARSKLNSLVISKVLIEKKISKVLIDIDISQEGSTLVNNEAKNHRIH